MASQISRARKVAALKIARKRIEHGESDFICWALDHSPDLHAVLHLKRYISDELYPSNSLGRWMARKHPETFEALDLTYGGLRQARLAWLDWMIENAT